MPCCLNSFRIQLYNHRARGKIETPNTNIHDCSLVPSLVQALKFCRVKLVLWAQTSPHSEM